MRWRGICGDGGVSCEVDEGYSGVSERHPQWGAQRLNCIAGGSVFVWLSLDLVGHIKRHARNRHCFFIGKTFVEGHEDHWRSLSPQIGVCLRSCRDFLRRPSRLLRQAVRQTLWQWLVDKHLGSMPCPEPDDRFLRVYASQEPNMSRGPRLRMLIGSFRMVVDGVDPDWENQPKFHSGPSTSFLEEFVCDSNQLVPGTETPRRVGGKRALRLYMAVACHASATECLRRLHVSMLPLVQELRCKHGWIVKATVDTLAADALFLKDALNRLFHPLVLCGRQRLTLEVLGTDHASWQLPLCTGHDTCTRLTNMIGF